MTVVQRTVAAPAGRLALGHAAIRHAHVTLEQLLIDEAPDAVVVSADDGKVIYWNALAERMFGFSRDEAVGSGIAELIGVPDGRWQAPSQRAADSVQRDDFTCRRKDGERLQVAFASRPIALPGRRQRYLISHLRDVSQQRAERAARLVDDLCGELLQALPAGVLVVNAIGRVVFGNRQAQRLLGVSQRALCGRPVGMLLPAALRDSPVGRRIRMIDGPPPATARRAFELCVCRADGRELPIEFGVARLPTAEGPLFVALLRDLRRRRRAERAMRDSQQALEATARSKTEYLAAMSHELRTPLNAIVGFTGTLLMQLPGPLNAEQQRQLGLVQSSARNLLSLINDLLELSRIDAGKLSPRPEPVDLPALLRDIVDSLQPLADRKQLSLQLELPAGGCTLRADRRLLNQILVNLTGNAIKYTERGGVQLQLRPDADGEAVDVCIVDTGRGIAPDRQAQLFQPFMRFDGDGADAGSSGLGLHLAQRLAELCGATISLRSAPGVGSEFCLHLPGAPS